MGIDNILIFGFGVLFGKRLVFFVDRNQLYFDLELRILIDAI